MSRSERALHHRRCASMALPPLSHPWPLGCRSYAHVPSVERLSGEVIARNMSRAIPLGIGGSPPGRLPRTTELDDWGRAPPSLRVAAHRSSWWLPRPPPEEGYNCLPLWRARPRPLIRSAGPAWMPRSVSWLRNPPAPLPVRMTRDTSNPVPGQSTIGGCGRLQHGEEGSGASTRSSVHPSVWPDTGGRLVGLLDLAAVDRMGGRRVGHELWPRVDAGKRAAARCRTSSRRDRRWLGSYYRPFTVFAADGCHGPRGSGLSGEASEHTGTALVATGRDTRRILRVWAADMCGRDVVGQCSERWVSGVDGAAGDGA
jgi:hypothetical protein